jgi:hypothetical protein
MLFLRPPTQAADVLQFARKFNEGIRVEYKSAFDESVRRSTAKMISALANTLGGVAVIGVTTRNGIPQEPIVGFDIPNEELPLVIEQICLQGINPPVLPKITQVLSDTPGRCFLVIEVDASTEAPHAIENSRRVYVRTGNAANPYDLADVDTIIERFTRRRGLEELRIELIARQNARSGYSLLAGAKPKIAVSICPTFPHRPLAPRQDIWQFTSSERYRGGRFVPGNTIRRTNDGVNGSTAQGMAYLDVGQHGNVFWKAILEPRIAYANVPESVCLPFGDAFQSVLKCTVCASRLYRAVNYRGPIQIDVQMDRCAGSSMPFLQDPYQTFNLEDFRCIEPEVSAELQTNSENLDAEDDLIEVLQELLGQFCWSFWQPEGPFPDEEFRRYIALSARQWGFR